MIEIVAFAVTLAQSVDPPDEGGPLLYVAIGWAVTVTTTVVTLVLKGDLVLKRELDKSEKLYTEEKDTSKGLRESLDKNNTDMATLSGLLEKTVEGIQAMAREKTGRELP